MLSPERGKSSNFPRRGFLKDHSVPDNLAFFLERVGRRFSAKEAIRIKRKGRYEAQTYQELRDRAFRLGSGLSSFGLSKGDRVAILAENSPEWVTFFLAVVSAGGIAVPVDPQLTETEIENLIQDCTPRFIGCTARIDQKLMKGRDAWPFLEKRILLDSEVKESSDGAVVSFRSLLDGSSALPEAEVHPEDPAAILYTSGTTGRPKGAVLSHENFISEAFYLSEFVPVLQEDRCLFSLPLFHVYTLSTALVYLCSGGTIVFPLNLKPAEILSTLQENHITMVAGVPRFFEMFYREFIEKAGGRAEEVLKGLLQRGLRSLISGGGRLPLEIAHFFSTKGLRVQEGYGLTETTGSVAVNPLQRIKLGSVGKIIPGTKIKILDPNSEGIGEIAVSGPTVFKGYYKDHALSEPLSKEGWFATGDLGRIDEDGSVFITGRKKDVIVLSSGKNVYPEEVESLYGRSPYIERIGVTKMETNGREEVFAFIVPKHGNGDSENRPDREGIQAKIRDEISRISLEISPHKRITRFQICDHDLLCTRLGKIKRHELAALAKSEQDREHRSIAPSSPPEEAGKIAECLLALLRKRLSGTKALGLESHLELDLGIDSLGRTELIATIEDLFRLSVPDDEVVKIQTVGDLVKLIQAHTDSIPDLSEALSPSSKEDDTIPERLDFTRQGQERRVKWIAERTGVPLEYLSRTPFDPALLKGNIEHFIGMAQVPVGLAGPLSLAGEAAQGTFYVPMATTEGALIASVTRGMMAITRSGGARARVLEDQVMRAPVFLFDRGRHAERFIDWLKANFEAIKAVAESTTRNGKLKRLEYFPLGRRVSVRFIYSSGDAAGQNMVTLATEAACRWIEKEQPVEGWQAYFLDANLAGDKKMSMVNFLSARGKKVYADAIVKREVLKHFLHTTPEELADFHKEGGLGSMQAGIWGLNAHYANMLAAIFIATGQDVACVHEAATGITVAELSSDGDLYMSVTLPNLIVGTVGGGTGKGTQRECLELIGCAGSGKVEKLAEIIAGCVLAGELSIAGAHAAHDFAQAHDRLGRNRPS